MIEDLQAIVDRARSGTLKPADIHALVAAIQSGQMTLATGQQAIGIGGSANGAVVVTGDGNVLLNIADTEVVLKILQSLNSGAPPAQPSPKATFQQFPEVSRFDLTQLVERCLEELLSKRGLIGLAVPCGEKAFLKNFCDRLKHELGRSNTQIRQPLSLNPQVISVSKAVEAIQQYKKLLQTNDVICPIRVGVRDASSSIPKDFWLQLQFAFQDNFKYRLIVVMVGSADCIFPPDAILFHPPQFQEIHAFQWIRDIARSLNWEDVMDEWRQKMIDRCLGDDLQPGCLDIGLVYEHLDFTLSLLQRNPSLSAEAFLEQLD